MSLAILLVNLMVTREFNRFAREFSCFTREFDRFAHEFGCFTREFSNFTREFDGYS
ncbi:MULTISPECIES: hypothetical protein [Peribacillus]|uniref:hypothetical protein n=1 Tax=Peribacillus TaxID=2675229 RepID=UPI00296F6248|nr:MULTISPECIES: hypothetical protein [Peribacillus]MEA3574749.1 hypothetical protein [Peribacillus frigoritolerans]